MEGKPMTVWVNSNAENVELFLNGKSLGSKTMPRNSHLNWEVPYKPGILEAVGIRNGKKFTTKIETTGQPAKIRIETDKTTLLADGADAAVINISVTDSKGREVPDAQNLIRFTIEGDARIIGVGNGDPSSHEPDKCPDGHWQRHLFSGKCQVIVQAGKQSGPVRLIAASEGLEEGACWLRD
jgi:beta-galactosidase